MPRVTVVGILITPTTLKKLKLGRWPNPRIRHGDVALTLLAYLADIPVENLAGLNWNSLEFYGENMVATEQITFHYMSESKIFELWRDIKSQQTTWRKIWSTLR
jgi:hypothetical protein